MKSETITVRDLLPVKAVLCHLNGTLVPFYSSCKGEGKRSGKPCEFYVPTYMCRYLRNLGIGMDSHEIKRQTPVPEVHITTPQNARARYS